MLILSVVCDDFRRKNANKTKFNIDQEQVAPSTSAHTQPVALALIFIPTVLFPARPRPLHSTCIYFCILLSPVSPLLRDQDSLVIYMCIFHDFLMTPALSENKAPNKVSN